MSIRPFTPRQERARDLEWRTVGRDQLLGVLDERLRAAATTRTRQHTLLVGPRGCGKTHLLEVATHRAMGQEPLRAGLAVAKLPEDVVGLTGYPDLLREAARGVGVDPGRERDPVALETAILDGIGDKVLVLVVENLDRAFRALGLPGQRNLRSWVETSGQVLILAATPSLFADVRDRAKPWFGGLIPTPVEGLTAGQGRELLTILAQDNGQDDLVELLASERGRGRVEAVSQLTAGSPRIWMVLSEVLSAKGLDELLPAVQGLVEGLVPYYQSLLWDLPDNHQAIIRHLAEGASAAATAKEIAADTGLTQQTVSKALGLLQEGRWVRARKAPGLDQRLTWYSLREPMLRHHFQWRATGGEPLTLIVELLRTWYDPAELLTHLAAAAPASFAERYVVDSLEARGDVPSHAYSADDPETLLASARQWIPGGNRVLSPECGLLVEACVLASQGRDDEIAHRLATIDHPADLADTVHALLTRKRSLPALLEKAADLTDGATSAGLRLIASGLCHHTDPGRARSLLAGIETEPLPEPLRLVVAMEHACLTADQGQPAQACQLLSPLTAEIQACFGPDDPTTLRSRSRLAMWRGEARDAGGALAQFEDLLPDQVRVLGADHSDTWATRASLLLWRTQAGEAVDVMAALRDLLQDPAHNETGSRETAHLIELVVRAIHGDDEAIIRLPAELQDVALEIRTRSGTFPAESGLLDPARELGRRG